MSEHRIIKADYANWRPVAGRKVLQLVFEVPIEQTEDVLTRLGVPMPGESKWCAIALLESGLSASENSGTPPNQTQKPSDSIEPREGQTGNTPSPTNVPSAASGTSETQKAKDRKPFASLPIAQQCALRCADRQFQEYMCWEFWNTMVDDPSEEYTAQLVRDHLQIESRAFLKDNVAAQGRWHQLEGMYQGYLTTKQYAESVCA